MLECECECEKHLAFHTHTHTRTTGQILDATALVAEPIAADMNDDGVMDAGEHHDLRGGEIVSAPDPQLIQQVEEAFGVLLPDDDLARIKTAGELYRLVLIELKMQPTPSPAIPFHRLRRAVQAMAHHGIAVPRPSTRLDVLFPKPSRMEDWKRLAAASQLDLPLLRPYRWLRDTIRIATGVVASAAFVAMVLITRPSGLLWFPPLLVAAFAGLVTYRGLFVGAHSLFLEFPVRSLGELAQVLVETNPAAFVDGVVAAPTPQQIWDEIVAIASDVRISGRESGPSNGSTVT